MDYEAALKQIAKSYEAEGYNVVVRPGQDQLPEFAKGFQADMVATRADEGVIVEVKQDRAGLEIDPEIVQLAQNVNNQPGWRYDLHVLDAFNELRRTAQMAGEPTPEQIEQMLKQAETLLRFVPLSDDIRQRTPGIDDALKQHAFMQAWAALEAAMRHASVEENGNGKPEFNPTVLVRKLYANGLISLPEFHLIDANRQMRNSIVHGFGPVTVHPNQVESLTAIARKLLLEQEVKA